jgi:prepilin-type N-terminal cleavage/methylation domain-containing protein
MIAHKNKKGFTLIELLVVIAIIGMLSSIVLSSLRTARTKAEDTGKIRELQEIRNALQLYYTDNGYYPGGLEWINQLTGSSKKYIPSINGSNFAYVGVTSTNTTCGTLIIAGGCPSYHIGVVLKQFNVVLNSDKDATASFDGKNIDCTTGGSTATELCYDLTP